MEIDKSKVVKLLAQVTDPVTGQNLIAANLVRDLEVSDGQVQFTLELPKLDADYKQRLNFACLEAIQREYPQADVHVHMMTRTPESGQSTSALPHIQNIIAVASGKGGVGKSTIATNLALGLQQLGARVGLLDADVYGPSIPTMLNLHGKRPPVEEIHGKPKIKPLYAYGLPVMSIGFIVEPEQAVVLRGPRLAGIVRQFFLETIWPPLDYLVVDLPPGTGDVQLTLVQTVPVTGVVLVTTPQEVAVADAVKAMNMFRLPSVEVPILGVVENMAWFTPAELPNNKYYLFGKGGAKKLAKLSNSMVLSQIPLVQGVMESGDAGKPAILQEMPNTAKEALEKMARNVARQTAIRNEMLEPTRIVKMQQ